MKGFRCVHRVGEVQLKIISQTPPAETAGTAETFLTEPFRPLRPFRRRTGEMK
jgi:hypothetical protein